MRSILLTQGYIALVDDADFVALNKYKWTTTVNKTSTYAYRRERGTQTHILMHRQIMGFPNSEVDHIDHDGLNNVRDNLRVATRQQNLANQRKRLGLTSKYKGVHYDKRRDKWVAQIKVSGKRFHLGRFTSELAAAVVYSEAATKAFGAFSSGITEASI